MQDGVFGHGACYVPPLTNSKDDFVFIFGGAYFDNERNEQIVD